MIYDETLFQPYSAPRHYVSLKPDVLYELVFDRSTVLDFIQLIPAIYFFQDIDSAIIAIILEHCFTNNRSMFDSFATIDAVVVFPVPGEPVITIILPCCGFGFFGKSNFSAIYFSRFFSSSNSLLYPKTINQQTQKPLPKKMPPAFFAKPKEAKLEVDALYKGILPFRLTASAHSASVWNAYPFLL